MTNERILIVEDEGLVATDIKAHLEDNGWNVPAIVPSGEEALEMMRQNHYDLVLMDIVLNGKKDGIETAAIIRDQYMTPIIYLTAYTDLEKITRARMTNPYGYLVKPFDERELKTTVSMSLSKAVNDRAISEGKRWINAVLESIEDGVITTDSYGRIRDVNNRAEDITGELREDCIDKQLSDIVLFSSENTQKQLKHTINQLLDTGTNSDNKIEGYLKSSHNNIYVEARLSSISYSGNEIDGIVMTLNDVTLQHDARLKLKNYNTELERQIEEHTHELKSALDRAEAANKAKSRFLNNISHELRTPLNPISGFSQLLITADNLDDKQVSYVKRINESCKVLLKKINDLIDLSHIETENIVANNVKLNPIQLVNEVAHSYRKQFEKNEIEFETIYSDDSIQNVLGDYDRLSDVLNRLTDNALKFTEHGTVKLIVDTISENADSLLMRFSVDDTGTGLPESIKDDLFDKFSQADDTSTRRYQGTGIGLALCKQTIEALGGKIGADTKPTGGSVFWFEIRLEKTD